MRTLLLSSAGVRRPIPRRELLSVLKKKPGDTTVAYVTTASKVEQNTSYVDEDRQVLKELGFKIKELDIAGMSQTDLAKILGDVNIVYVQGGNGFYLLSHVKKTGFETIVKELINKGVLYMGVSAGTYICCPTIEMHHWKKVHDDTYGLEDLSAMNLVPFLITVHFNREKYREKVKAGIALTKLPVKILTDDQVLLVQDDKVTLLGDGEEIDPMKL